MPARAVHACAVAGCPVLLERGRRCRAHAAEAERARPNLKIRGRYRLQRWKALRARVLREAAYQCAGCGGVFAALEVDHVMPHRGDRRLFWSRANLQALCRACHQRKTRKGE